MMQKRIYANACTMKLKNRRVSVFNMNDKEIQFQFVRLCDTPEEASCTEGLIYVVRDKIKITNISLSNESALALYYALGEKLTLANIPKEYLILE